MRPSATGSHLSLPITLEDPRGDLWVYGYRPGQGVSVFGSKFQFRNGSPTDTVTERPHPRFVGTESNPISFPMGSRSRVNVDVEERRTWTEGGTGHIGH